MASPPEKERHVSYGVGGAGNMRRASDRTTAAEELSRMASNASASAASAVDTTYNALTGATSGDRQRQPSFGSDDATLAPDKEGMEKEMQAQKMQAQGSRKSSIVDMMKGAFGGRK